MQLGKEVIRQAIAEKMPDVGRAVYQAFPTRWQELLRDSAGFRLVLPAISLVIAPVVSRLIGSAVPAGLVSDKILDAIDDIRAELFAEIGRAARDAAEHAADATGHAPGAAPAAPMAAPVMPRVWVDWSHDATIAMFDECPAQHHQMVIQRGGDDKDKRPRPQVETKVGFRQIDWNLFELAGMRTPQPGDHVWKDGCVCSRLHAAYRQKLAASAAPPAAKAASAGSPASDRRLACAELVDRLEPADRAKWDEYIVQIDEHDTKLLRFADTIGEVRGLARSANIAVFKRMLNTLRHDRERNAYGAAFADTVDAGLERFQAFDRKLVASSKERTAKLEAEIARVRATPIPEVGGPTVEEQIEELRSDLQPVQLPVFAPILVGPWWRKTLTWTWAAAGFGWKMTRLYLSGAI